MPPFFVRQLSCFSGRLASENARVACSPMKRVYVELRRAEACIFVVIRTTVCLFMAQGFGQLNDCNRRVSQTSIRV